VILTQHSRCAEPALTWILSDVAVSTFPPPNLPQDTTANRLERLARRRDAAGSPPPVGGAVERSTRQRRRHPARGARLGALVISCASAGGLTYLFAAINSTQASATALAALPPPVTASTPASTTQPTTDPGIAASTTAVAVASAMTAYDGQVAETKYGPVQIQVQLTDGAISDVAVIEYPDGDGKSVRINARALPTLRSEVLTAQSAQVDTVSGATYTSDAYTQSLQSAIDQARAAGATSLA
jgi:uncharacterized protein with FMN-binding domain